MEPLEIFPGNQFTLDTEDAYATPGLQFAMRYSGGGKCNPSSFHRIERELISAT